VGRQDAGAALDYFQKAIDIDRDYADAYMGMGLSYVLKGEGLMALEPLTALRRLRRYDLVKIVEDAVATGKINGP
jgi:tetratricopeptide (TPR) repeat protein